MTSDTFTLPPPEPEILFVFLPVIFFEDSEVWPALHDAVDLGGQLYSWKTLEMVLDCDPEPEDEEVPSVREPKTRGNRFEDLLLTLVVAWFLLFLLSVYLDVRGGGPPSEPASAAPLVI